MTFSYFRNLWASTWEIHWSVNLLPSYRFQHCIEVLVSVGNTFFLVWSASVLFHAFGGSLVAFSSSVMLIRCGNTHRLRSQGTLSPWKQVATKSALGLFMPKVHLHLHHLRSPEAADYPGQTDILGRSWEEPSLPRKSSTHLSLSA